LLRRRLEELWLERDEAVGRTLARCGVRSTVLSTGDDLVSGLLRVAAPGRAR
jgi:uncharacterized protein (DUF58 family)